MEGPPKIRPRSLADYLETMSKSVFQTGISWKVVEVKWPGIKDAFHGFDPVLVTQMRDSEIGRLIQDSRIIRNSSKIEAILLNARKMLALDKAYGGFRKYLRSFSSFDELILDMKRQFKYLGDMGAYHFLWVVGESVPSWEEWSSSHMGKNITHQSRNPHQKVRA